MIQRQMIHGTLKERCSSLILLVVLLTIHLFPCYSLISTPLESNRCPSKIKCDVNPYIKSLARTSLDSCPHSDKYNLFCTSKRDYTNNNNRFDMHRTSAEETRRNVLLHGIANISKFAFAAVLATTAPTRAAWATYTDPKTGVSLPSEGEIENAIPKSWNVNSNNINDENDADDPFASLDTKTSFGRLDSTSDALFYAEPRFVEHVDDNAVQTMTSYISNTILQPGDEAVLDLCSSWTSHVDVPTITSRKIQLNQVVGLGMNEQELKANALLTSWDIVDLNASPNPKLPYADGTYDAVLCQLSIDYLIHPLKVMEEVGRVLKPGGRVAIFFSNRLFLQKAVGLWTGADDIDHAYTVGAYLKYCAGGFTNIKALDLSTRRGNRNSKKDRLVVGDPLYVVTAEKSA